MSSSENGVSGTSNDQTTSNGDDSSPPPFRKESPKSCECEVSLLETEAAAAIREVSFALRNVSISEILPRTSDLLFLNITTLEGLSYCIELTAKGWRITSNRSDCMNGDFRQLDTHIRFFETIYQLLDTISPLYREKFGDDLSSKLRQLDPQGSQDKPDDQPSA